MVENKNRKFGKYHLIAHLATGGMAEIYLASQKSIGGFEKLLVIKRILPNLSRDKKFIEMFLDEARIAAQLNHPNVIQIFDMGIVDGRFFIAMEYLSGESLAMLIKTCSKEGKAIPVALAAGMVMQAAEGLHHAHSMKSSDGKSLGIVHRDISPQNIFIQYDGGVKVVDFGIAKATMRSSHTKTGTLKGKYSYMSPEQVHGTELDARSDVFALGIVLWECLVGRKLFNQKNDLELLKAVVSAETPSPSEINTNTPRDLADITMKALDKNLETRFQSAAELRAALAGFLKTRDEDSDTIAIGNFMRAHFKERIAKKQSIIEGARAIDHELGDTLFGDLDNYLSDTEISVPNSTGSMQASRAYTRKKPIWPKIATIIFLLVAGSISGAYLIFTNGNKDANSEKPNLVTPIGSSSATIASPSSHKGQESMPSSDAGTIVDRDGGILASTTADSHTNKADRKTKVSKNKKIHSRKRKKKKRKNTKKVKPVKPETMAHKDTKPKGPPGKLRLVTTPWSNVYFQGKKLGQTPLIDTVLPAGQVKLRVVNKEAGIDRVIVVNIKPGKKNVYRQSLY